MLPNPAFCSMYKSVHVTQFLEYRHTVCYSTVQCGNGNGKNGSSQV